MRTLILLLIIFTPFLLQAQNHSPTIEISGAIIQSQEILVNFDIADAEMDDLEITFYVARPDETFQAVTTGLTGDIDFPVSPGNNKQIIWDFGSLQPSPEWRIRIVADDRYSIDIQDIVDQVDSNSLKSYMAFVEGERVPHGTPDHLNKVKDSLLNHFYTLGLDTQLQAWKYMSYEAGNVIGNLPGLKNEAHSYVIDAHFDGVAGSPAADDNGSGVVGVMEAARVLSKYNFNKSVRFIGFDIEELGLVGSKKYVKEGIPERDSLKGVFNFEMIGYYTERKHSQSMPTGFNIVFPQAYAQIEADSFRGNFITNVSNTNSKTTSDLFDTAAARYVPDLKVIPVAVSGNGQMVPDLRRSDHASFWDAGYQALMITDGADFRNPNYHSPNDVSDSLSFTFMANVVKATVAAMAMGAEVTNATAADINLSWPAAVSEINDPSHIIIAPNPAEGYITLHSDRLIEGEIKVIINDISGRQVKDIVIQNLHGSQLIDVSGFSTGQYILKVETENGIDVFSFIVR